MSTGEVLARCLTAMVLTAALMAGAAWFLGELARAVGAW